MTGEEPRQREVGQKDRLEPVRYEDVNMRRGLKGRNVPWRLAARQTNEHLQLFGRIPTCSGVSRLQDLDKDDGYELGAGVAGVDLARVKHFAKAAGLEKIACNVRPKWRCPTALRGCGCLVYRCVSANLAIAWHIGVKIPKETRLSVLVDGRCTFVGHIHAEVSL